MVPPHHPHPPPKIIVVPTKQSKKLSKMTTIWLATVHIQSTNGPDADPKQQQNYGELCASPCIPLRDVIRTCMYIKQSKLVFLNIYCCV